MPAGRRQRLAAINDARPLDAPLGHGARDAEVSAARITDRCEAAMQHALHDLEGARGG